MPEGQNDRAVYWGTGRRKSSIARVRLVPGNGQIKVNGKEGNIYFNQNPKTPKPQNPKTPSGE